MYVRTHREGCILQYAKYFWKVAQNQEYQEASFMKHLLWKSKEIHLGSGRVSTYFKRPSLNLRLRAQI